MHNITVDDRNDLFDGADPAVSCRRVQMHCAQHAKLLLVTLLCLNPVHCILTSYSKSYGWLPHNFTAIFSLLTWQTCFSSCGCFETLHQKAPVTTAASHIPLLGYDLCNSDTMYQAYSCCCALLC